MDGTRQGDVRGQHTYGISDVKQLTVDANADEADRFVAKNNEEVLGGEKQGRGEGVSCLNTTPLSTFIFSPHQTPAPGHAPYQLPPPQDKHAAKLRVLLLCFSLPLPGAQNAGSLARTATPKLTRGVSTPGDYYREAVVVVPTMLPAQQATSVPPLTTPALLITAEPL